MKFSEKITKLQEGGPMPAEAPAEGAPVEGAPTEAPQGGEEQLQQVAGQLVDMLMQQVGDPNAVMAILQAAMDMVAQAVQGAAPAYRRDGGRLVRVR